MTTTAPTAASRTPPDATGDGLRAWQREALDALERFLEGRFLISAAPGAGKTRPALEFARQELAARRIDQVVIACPTAPLTRQWARAAHALGLELAPDAETVRPPRGFHGVAVTYARIVQDAGRWAAAGGDGTLVVADEAHHLGDELAWGESFARAFADAPRWLLLSGTPFRSDAAPIPGVSYDAGGVAEPDVAYGYAEAVRDGVCRPVVFVAYDGALTWQSGEDVIESSFETVLSTREAGRRYRTAISTELPDGLPRILREADARLQALRAADHHDAGGLVIAADSAHARRIAALLREATGRVPVVVLHQEARASAKLAAFTHTDEPWIVAVNMVSEGVDIPRLRVGVYATAAKTPLIFRQIVGRFVRTIPGRPAEPSWLYIPADPILRDHAATVEHDVRGGLKQRGEGGEEDRLDEAPERRQTERTGELDFVPLAADVAPQMTLFGSPAAPPANTVISPIPVTPPAQPAAPPLPTDLPEPPIESPPKAAFERRADLRAERHRLVSEIRRQEGTSHRELNQWVNHRIGVRTVEQATIAQLERSVEALRKRLAGRR